MYITGIGMFLDRDLVININVCIQLENIENFPPTFQMPTSLSLSLTERFYAIFKCLERYSYYYIWWQLKQLWLSIKKIKKIHRGRYIMTPTELHTVSGGIFFSLMQSVIHFSINIIEILVDITANSWLHSVLWIFLHFCT